MWHHADVQKKMFIYITDMAIFNFLHFSNFPVNVATEIVANVTLQN
jgi:hypothetical protein